MGVTPFSWFNCLFLGNILHCDLLGYWLKEKEKEKEKEREKEKKRKRKSEKKKKKSELKSSICH